jgi:hypothetical protein
VWLKTVGDREDKGDKGDKGRENLLTNQLLMTLPGQYARLKGEGKMR